MAEQAKVDTRHPEYEKLQAKREVVADLRGGTSALREKGRKYLPQFPAEQDAVYDVRVSTATLFNVYSKTEKTMSGLVFKGEPDTSKLNIDAAILENFDNKGTPFTEFARDVFAKAFDGAVAILVDAPNPPEGVETLEDVNRLGIRPYAVIYPQSEVINWRYEVNPISKATELTLIVLHEETNEPNGDFGWAEVERYRVFRKDLATGVVSWELWREDENKADNDPNKFILEGGPGVLPLTQIPVAIMGDLCNEPPMLDLALLNIKHFQKESNFDNLEWLAAVPMPFAKGRDTKNPVIVAPDAFLDLPADGDCGWMQIDSEGFASLRESLSMLVDQMSLLGLSMLADKAAKVDLTATEALLKNIGETAELRIMAQELKDALEEACMFMGQYLGQGADNAGEITLNTAWAQAEEAAQIQGAIVPPQSGDGAGMVN